MQKTNRFDKLLSDLMQKYSSDVGMIFRLEPEDDYLYLIAVKGKFPEHLMETMSRIPNGKGVAGETALSKKPVVSCNITAPDAPVCVRPMAKTMGILGIISFPVLDGDEVVGTIGLGTFHERQFTQQEVNELLATGRKLANELKQVHCI